MTLSYLKTALRALLRHKGYAFINIAGLAVGTACCLVILLYVRAERSYDRYHERADRVYRVVSERRDPGGTGRFATSPRSMAEALARDVPEVERATRLSREHAGQVLVRHGDRSFFETGVVFADSNVFDVFTIPLVQGDPQTALARPFTVVITEPMARKYFGDADPLGQTLTLRLQGDGDRFDYEVTGVAGPPPGPTHAAFDLLAAYQQHPFATTDGEERANWLTFDVYTYALLRPEAAAGAVEDKLPALVERYAYPGIEGRFGTTVGDFLAAGNGFRYTPQPLTSIHLHSRLRDELQPNGDAAYVQLFVLVALFILVLACINFVNLATARSAERAREVGVRKVLGSQRGQLVRQFLVEAVLLTGLALLLSVALVEVALPVFNRTAGLALGLGQVGTVPLVAGLAAFVLLVGLGAGLYPALYLSAFEPATVLKRAGGTSGRSRLRNGLVVFQFAVTVVLLVGTAVVYRQVGFMLGTGLGFEPEAVVVLEGTEVLKQQTEAFRQALLERPEVVHAAHAETLPGRALGTSMVRLEGADEATQVPMAWMFSGFDLAETLALEVTAGRTLSTEFAGDSTGALLNEAAVRALGLTEPVGKQIVWRNARTYTVVGVLRDFHYASLHETIGPQVIFGPDPFFENRPRQVFAVRVRTENLAGTLAGLEATWDAFVPEQPFSYTFLDADLGRLYRAEQRIGALFAGFTALALLIACLGLFGLAAFTAERRTREIGVRKVLGATVAQIVLLLSKDFLRLVGLAFVLAAPVAYLGASRWLQNFAYRIDPGWGVFAGVGAAVLAVALLTVSYQALRAAVTDPVRTLRYE